MYRLLENIRPARKTADTQQEATAKEAANRLGKSVEGAVENHRPQFAGRPVTSAGTRNAT